MAWKHSHVSNHAVKEMDKNSTNNEIDAWVLKMHDLDTVLERAEDGRIQPPVDTVRGVVNQ